MIVQTIPSAANAPDAIPGAVDEQVSEVRSVDADGMTLVQVVAIPAR